MEQKRLMEKLVEKIDEILKKYNEIKLENESLRNELVALKAQNELKDNEIKKLEEEIGIKELQIEEIIEKIERML